MIKKLLLAALIAIPSMGFAQKFAVVKTQTIIEAMPDMTAARTQIEAASKKYEDEFKNLTDAFQKSFEEYQKIEGDASTPQTIKERRVQELQEMQQKIEQFRSTATQDLQRQQEQLMAPIQQKVMDAIKGVGASDNYTMIFEDVLPLYIGTDVDDITPKVKTRLGLK